ncbi:MAG: nitroreductase, partial [Pseudonocardia sp.]|nr:nitroreductase [Pseudonocardia sp.]
MAAKMVGPRTVRTALELACRAPSVHNTQPWRWRLGDDTVALFADQRRRLWATDRDARDLILSCGAALHHLRVALAAAGVDS